MTTGLSKAYKGASEGSEAVMIGYKGASGRTGWLLIGYKWSAGRAACLLSGDKWSAERAAWLLNGDKRPSEHPADGMNGDKGCAGRTAYRNIPCGMKRWAADDGNVKSQREVKPITNIIRRYGN